MNTPSHAILNLFLLDRDLSGAMPVLAGAIAPDAPLFLFYLWTKGVRRLSERKIWSEAYYQPFWQNLTHLFHSFPIGALGAWVAWQLGWHAVFAFWCSFLLHAAGDFPVHNDDAHRHFLPFSNYCFRSPLSYWDPAHHGRTVALVEKILVWLAAIALFPSIENMWGRGALVIVGLAYAASYLLERRRSCGGLYDCQSDRKSPEATSASVRRSL